MKINFYLKGKASKGDTTQTKKAKQNVRTYVELRMRYDGQTFVYGTGINATSLEWDDRKQKQRFKSQSSKVHHNKYLDYLEEEIEGLYIQNKTKGIHLSLQQFREQVKQHLNKSLIKEKTFFDYLKQDYKEAKHLKASPSARIGKSTVAKYNCAVKHLEIYQDVRRVVLTFDSMTKGFYNDFVSYFTYEYFYTEKGKTIVGLDDSTIGCTVKNIKAFLSWAEQEGLHSNTAYKNFKVMKAEKEQIITLNDDEYQQLLDVNLGDDEKLQRVRDIFVLGIAVGARVSDLLVLKHSNIAYKDGNYFIEYLPEKTIKHRSKPLSVPIVSNEAVAIIKKYNEQIESLLTKISKQEFNKLIKVIARRAKITDKVNKTKTQGGREVIIDVLPKWQMLTSHCMRRTFITRALKAGLPVQLVMECSGHTDYKSFQRYIDFSNSKDKAEAFKKLADKSAIMKLVA
ncbi:tyrosine-type recombinase/integrase [Pontibacter sp. BT310]|uniref:Site-specific integrase n=1 Tax=Pontibacter populi TaxID=890055 RepID=A0ABS6XED7_9BACT|nr:MULTISPECIES: tyrosine-type recombinase/integrase [Pontibacter]MBJ6119499.1 tyrosine-type recombinase/integrase [Pontibacter sp. BT310]MBR0571927.1 tyrosine-type recombinase/integrase [Microvirga sp. STS03]MBW3366353.1 site-specific integrase [Pontibacter populi]